MKIQIFFLFCCLIGITAIEPTMPMSTDNRIRLGEAKQLEHGISKTINYKNQTKQENKYSPESINIESQQKSYQIKRMISSEEESKNFKGFLPKSELYGGGAKGNENYLQTELPILFTHLPYKRSAPLKLKPVILPKVLIPSAVKLKKILLPPKMLLPKKHPLGLLGSTQNSEDYDSPELKMLRQLMSSGSDKNNEIFKHALLTKTITYNVTKLTDPKQNGDFFMEKKDNLTLNMKYLDSQDRETDYSNTHSSKLQKVIGSEIFETETSQERNFEESDENSNKNRGYLMLDSNEVLKEQPDENLAHGSEKSSKGAGKISVPDYNLRAPTEFVGGTFISSGPADEDSQTTDKDASLPESIDFDNYDLLGQSNEVNKLYPTPLMVGTTIADFKNEIENIMLGKGNEDSSTNFFDLGLETTTLKSNVIEFDKYERTSSTKHSDESKSDEFLGLTENSPEVNQKLMDNKNANPIDPSREASANLNTTTPITFDKSPTNANDDGTALIVKHGESLILQDSNYEIVTQHISTANQKFKEMDTTEKDLSNESPKILQKQEVEETAEEDATTIEFLPTLRTSSHTKKSKDNAKLRSDERLDESSEEDFEDNNLPIKNTLQSILVTDPQTEESSTEESFTNTVTDSSDYKDSTIKVVENEKDKLLSHLLKETVEDPNESNTEEDQTLDMESTLTDDTKDHRTTLNDKKSKLKDMNEDDESSKNDDNTFLGKPKDSIPSDWKTKEFDSKMTTLNAEPSTTNNIQDLLFDDKKVQNYIDLLDSLQETTEMLDKITGEASNFDPNKIKFDKDDTIDLSDLTQGSILDNEIFGGYTTTSHAVELWGGNYQNKGQQVTDDKEDGLKNSLPTSTSKVNIELDKPTEEILTELCFPIKNEKEVSLYDLLSGKIYLENEGKKRFLLKIQPNSMKNCNSGTKKCKLPIDFAKSSESSKENGSNKDDVDETDDNYSISQVRKRQIEEDFAENRREDFRTEDFINKLQSSIKSPTKELSEQHKMRQICLHDLLLQISANQTFSTNKTRRTSSHDVHKSSVEVSQTESNEEAPVVTNEAEPKPIVSPLLLFGIGKNKTEQQNPYQMSRKPVDSNEDSNKKRFKRTILGKQDAEQKEGGCGCSSMLGRTLQPIPNHDHFLGKRLNIITSIAHAIKDLAMTAH